MELTLEELFDLAEAVSETIGLPLEINRTPDGVWTVNFAGTSKRDHDFDVRSGPQESIEKALITALKAVRPTGKQEAGKLLIMCQEGNLQQ